MEEWEKNPPLRWWAVGYFNYKPPPKPVDMKKLLSSGLQPSAQSVRGQRDLLTGIGPTPEQHKELSQEAMNSMSLINFLKSQPGGKYRG